MNDLRMPAEWEPHEATWFSWPRRDGISFPDAYDEVMPAFVQMVRALAGSERVYINVGTEAQEAEVRKLLGGLVGDEVRLFPIPSYEPWCRDHGPIFVWQRNELRILDWGYNAWGGKYPPFDLDDRVPTEIGRRLGIKVLSPGIILEGGSIEVNGSGRLLTTESCLLNRNRNSNLSQNQIEGYLRDYLGVNEILWLGDGIEGDDTDGHIDDLTRFVSKSTVVTVVETNRSDTNYQPLQKNLERLRTMRLEIIPLPMPAPIRREDLRLPASYANFYIANEVVLLPIFRDPSDDEAISTLESLFPKRKIVPIDCRALVWGLGTCHCLTQQQPRSS